MAETTNYKLFVPELDAAADMGIFANNMGIIDEVMKENSDKADAAQAAAAASAADVVAEKEERENAVTEEAAAREAADEEIKTAVESKAASSHSHAASNITSGTFAATGVKARTGTDYSTARVRNIYAGTADLTAGSSTLSSGDIYLVYE